MHIESHNGGTKWICFLTVDDNLLKKCNDIWTKVTNSIKKDFDGKPICNKKFLKIKIKFYGDEATDFHDEEIPKVGSNYICLTLILIDFVL